VISTTTTARPSTARSLTEICAAARQANCGECWQVPGVPCTMDPQGDHVARFGRAARRGLISGTELVAVLGLFQAFTTSTIVKTPSVGRESGPDASSESCPRCGAVSWGQTPDGRRECTRCLWSEPAS
jgi:hypothetical protein